MSESTCPKPGVYPNVDFADYVAWEAVNNSRLGAMEFSPKHYANPVAKESSGFPIGSLSHVGALEPTALAERYAVLPDWEHDAENVTASGSASKSKSTAYYKAKRAEFDDANPNVELVSRGDYAAMKGIVASLHDHADARRLIHEPGAAELSIVWDDPETGLRCKGRIDKLCSESGVLLDLKTTRDLAGFPKAIARYGYHRQQAFYAHGWATLHGGEWLTPWIAAVESSAPYACQCAPVGEEAIEQGASDYRRLLRLVADCHESGSWPGPESPAAWELPAWAVNTEPVALTVGGVTLEV